MRDSISAPRLLAALAVLAWATQASAQASPGGPTTALSPELRVAFIAEMQHLDTGLQRAISALARADWAALERIAVEIRGSFILEQKLDAQQMAELHRLLPEPFLALDREFHARAERLAAASRGADAELAAFSIYRLTDACASCHAQYAKHRFPGFTSTPEAHHH